ncbi:hypothetical protein JCM17845_15400 [Iodidimonas gelatinilytica]|uniref:Terminase small subunit n=1 Tax=Iodidimonas gelatinilytica TaxID=1236966 RepID=A0A5A7MYG3_9PROT|nr:hypothetical protein JCM17845_15400 [Iodidimonas gelatinilytica]
MGAETVVTLGELVSIPGMPSEPTMRKIIDQHSGFPLISRGKNGQGYEIPLERAVTWWKDHRAREEEEARRRGDDIRQMGLALLGEDAAVSQGLNGLTPAEQKAALEAEIAAIKLGQMRGDFVRAADIESEVGQIFVWFQQALAGLPDRLSKQMDISREQRDVLSSVCDDLLNDLADRLEDLRHEGSAQDSPDPSIQESTRNFIGGGPAPASGRTPVCAEMGGALSQA